MLVRSPKRIPVRRAAVAGSTFRFGIELATRAAAAAFREDRRAPDCMPRTVCLGPARSREGVGWARDADEGGGPRAPSKKLP